MSPQADYKYILSQSLFLGTIHPHIGSSLSLLHCQDITSWTVGTVPGGISTDGSVAPVQLWLVPVASFLLVTGEVPTGLMAKPMWPLSAAGEPFLRAKIEG